MKSLTLQDFRCFRDRQTARLAPLTLLVGENGTGKTSFSAMLRAMREIPMGIAPDFNNAPYGLGGFDVIANDRGTNVGTVDAFHATLECADDDQSGNRAISATFCKQGAAAGLATLKIQSGERWIEQRFGQSKVNICFGDKNSEWQYASEDVPDDKMLFLFSMPGLISTEIAPSASEADVKAIRSLLSQSAWQTLIAKTPLPPQLERTYDPVAVNPENECQYIPPLYAYMHFQRPDEWKRLKEALESFGKASGVFDQIVVRPLFGKTVCDPFQIHVRKFGKRLKGPFRNLVDVGHGVGHLLSVLTEVLYDRPNAAFLLQQPEAYLHPKAQAALGSLFCEIASRKRQLIVETHSDYLLDRVRMDIRDRKGSLKPEDVSVLYFEREDMDTKIHSIRFDKNGNVLDAPPSYGRFFMQEVDRSIGLRSGQSKG